MTLGERERDETIYRLRGQANDARQEVEWARSRTVGALQDSAHKLRTAANLLAECARDISADVDGVLARAPAQAAQRREITDADVAALTKTLGRADKDWLQGHSDIGWRETLARAALEWAWSPERQSPTTERAPDA